MRGVNPMKPVLISPGINTGFSRSDERGFTSDRGCTRCAARGRGWRLACWREAQGNADIAPLCANALSPPGTKDPNEEMSLLRLCSAAAPAGALTGCGEMPTATPAATASVRRNGGGYLGDCNRCSRRLAMAAASDLSLASAGSQAFLAYSSARPQSRP